ncbi:hypothetical protein TNCV_3889811 [Trichonephila clavipes]|nr:hypothetical protein TNCV_3889811 [Trichonephila clavipes]
MIRPLNPDNARKYIYAISLSDNWRMTDHILTNNLFIPEQHTFRAELSTLHELPRTVEYIKSGKRRGGHTGVDSSNGPQTRLPLFPIFKKRILFSVEAHIWLNGYVNKQNCRIWSEANPLVHVETLLHPEKLTVWCALWADGIVLQKR